jgi:hypothetical protein
VCVPMPLLHGASRKRPALGPGTPFSRLALLGVPHVSGLHVGPAFPSSFLSRARLPSECSGRGAFSAGAFLSPERQRCATP